MAYRFAVLFVSALSATAHQGDLEVAVHPQGIAESIDTVSMLQSPDMQSQSAKAREVIARERPTQESIFAKVKFQAVFAEFIAMILFVVIGCGSAMGSAGEPGWVLQVALSFGFAISSLAYAIGHYSGGQINCAVTFGLLLSGNISVIQAVFNIIAQILGAIIGAFFLTLICPQEMDKTKGIGSNYVQEGYSVVNALCGEAIMTFLLMFVVLETAINPATHENRALACLAIGLAVFLAHSVLIPMTGCSINPTRSLGPAVVSNFLYRQKTGEYRAIQDLWIFFAAPLGGAAGAALVYSALNA
jgi:MIP family channel proteins